MKLRLIIIFLTVNCDSLLYARNPFQFAESCASKIQKITPVAPVAPVVEHPSYDSDWHIICVLDNTILVRHKKNGQLRYISTGQ